MKVTISSIIFLLLFVCLYDSKGQNITPEQKQQIISSLDSNNVIIRYNAIKQIIQYEISEAIPKLKENMGKESVYMKYAYLNALLHFNDESVDSLALSLIDSARSLANKPKEFFDTTLIQLNATEILFRLGNYSKATYLFQYLNKHPEQPSMLIYTMLDSIISRGLPYTDSSKYYLEYLIKNDPNQLGRKRALSILVKYYDAEMLPVILNVFLTDTVDSWANRKQALDYLNQYNYSNIHSLLIQQLFNDPDKYMRYSIVRILLENYGTPSDFHAIEDYIISESDTLYKTVMNYELQEFRPLSFANQFSINDMITSLISIKDSSSIYHWLSDSNFVNELDSSLTLANNFISTGDSNNCYYQLKIFQSKIDKEYRDSLNGEDKHVTIEGWKFLYYMAQNILSKLPKLSAQFILNISQIGHGSIFIDPYFALYDSSAKVTITATPATGYHFIGWSGDDSDLLNSITLTMDANKNITANFAINTYTIHAYAESGGAIYPSGDTIVPYGTSLTFHIVPDSGYITDNILVDSISYLGDTVYTLSNITTNHVIDVTFIIYHTITVTSQGGGIIVPVDGAPYTTTLPPSPDSLALTDTTQLYIVKHNSSKYFALVASHGHVVDSIAGDGALYTGWMPGGGGGGRKYGNTRVIFDIQPNRPVYLFENITSDHFMHVLFVRSNYFITTTAGAHGSISPSGNVPVGYTETQIFTITPDSGYHVDSLLVDGQSQPVATSYTFTNVIQDHTIEVTFAQDQ